MVSLAIGGAWSANKEIFLRELISNSSDALEKIRFVSLTDPSVLSAGQTLEIRLIPDKTTRTLTIDDTGMGMSRTDLVESFGVIGKSGTRAFVEGLDAGARPDLNLIGRFGVGFYSSFLVADKVIVRSKKYNDEPWLWQSVVSCDESFTVSRDEGEPIARGTRVILHLKEDMEEFLEERRLTALVRRHSQFVAFPIRLLVQREREVKGAPGEDEDKLSIGKVSRNATQMTNSWHHLNPQEPIWIRDVDSVCTSEYACLYKTITLEFEGPLTWKHFSFKSEEVEFRGILFIPKRAPYDLFQAAAAHSTAAQNSIQLYVKRVFVFSEEGLLPKWLRFVRGIVDFDDLPLNISREGLSFRQAKRTLCVVKKALVEQTLELLLELAEEDEWEYQRFYWQFDRNIKLGVHEDSLLYGHKLAKLLRYFSTKSGDSLTSLDEYKARMCVGQESIYYVTGESLKALQDSPFIERLRSKRVEVLLMVDPLDEYVTRQLREYEGLRLVSVSSEALELRETEDEMRISAEQRIAAQGLCLLFKEALADAVERVPSNRLESSPCVLVTGEFGWSATMERIIKACSSSSSSCPRSTKILEINPTHPIMLSFGKKDSHGQKIRKESVIRLLFETALVTAGFSLEDPTSFVDQIHHLIELRLSMDWFEDESDESSVLEGDCRSDDALMEEVD